MKMILFLINLNAISLVMGSKFLLTRQVMTGSYSNFFRIQNLQSNAETILQADKSAFKNKNAEPRSKKEEFSKLEALDFSKKIIHSSWHPTENIVALAATNNLFLFNA